MSKSNTEIASELVCNCRGFTVDHEFTPEIVCPYCGYEFSESYEFSETDEPTCDSCERQFISERVTTVEYVTRKKT